MLLTCNAQWLWNLLGFVHTPRHLVGSPAIKHCLGCICRRPHAKALYGTCEDGLFAQLLQKLISGIFVDCWFVQFQKMQSSAIARLSTSGPMIPTTCPSSLLMIPTCSPNTITLDLHRISTAGHNEDPRWLALCPSPSFPFPHVGPRFCCCRGLA